MLSIIFIIALTEEIYFSKNGAYRTGKDPDT